MSGRLFSDADIAGDGCKVDCGCSWGLAGSGEEVREDA
jgi:hypothetical protein